MAAAVERFGRIDVLVNAAGVVGMGPAHLLPVAEFERIVDINLKGSFIISKHVLPTMLEQQSGSIVLVASVEGLMGLTGQVAYNASKGGVVLMAKTMAIDYASAGIRVNCVCPGGVDTAMTSMLHDEAMHSLRDQLRSFHAFQPLLEARGDRGRHPVPGVRRCLIRDGQRARGRRRIHRGAPAQAGLSGPGKAPAT